MGMFDTITISIDRLPISETDKERLKNENFQTKSLEKLLLRYRITDDGLLECFNAIADFEDEETAPPKSNNWIRIDDIHGYVSFYTSADDPHEWFEFVAKFTDGRLVDVFRSTESRYYGNRKGHLKN